jgi:DNA-binding CsgD family transcriptional regulator
VEIDLYASALSVEVEEARTVKIDSARFSYDGQLYGYLVVGRAEAPIAELTPAEREVAELVALGCSNREMAKRRGSSVHTVANQLAAIYAKAGVTTRQELIAKLAGSASQ